MISRLDVRDPAASNCECTEFREPRRNRCSTGRSSIRSRATASPASTGRGWPYERPDDQPNPFAPARPDAAELEGYNWGGLTSGSPGRAFWLLLLPFTLVNIAPRARPAANGPGSLVAPRRPGSSGTPRGCSRWPDRAVRAHGGRHRRGPHRLAMRRRRRSLRQSVARLDLRQAARHLVATESASAACRPSTCCCSARWCRSLLLLLLWLSSQRTIDRYELIAPSGPAGERAATIIDDDSRRRTPSRSASVRRACGAMRAQVRRLRAVHLQFGFAVILWTLLLPSVRLPAGPLSVADVIAAHSGTGTISPCWCRSP